MSMNPRQTPDTETGGPTSVYCILGKPVAQSLSPLMHNAAFRHLDINAVYVPFEIDDLAGALVGLKSLKIRGASITHPFKEKIITLIDAVDDTAEAIGAVNTLVLSDDLVKGTNTDWIGVIRTIETLIHIEGHTFTVLGAGGAARAAVYGIIRQGGQVVVVNRSEIKGRLLAAEFNTSFVPLSRLKEVRTDCLINTTPVGMYPHVNVSPVPEDVLPEFGAVVDLIYNPFQTQLLKQAQSHGCKTASGLEMFVHQGMEQFTLWTGVDPPAQLMKDVVYRRLTGKNDSDVGRQNISGA